MSSIEAPDLKGIQPGSAAERAELAAFRDQRDAQTTTYAEQVKQGLEASATRGVVRPQDAQAVHAEAWQRTTGEVPPVVLPTEPDSDHSEL